jgi:S1-C subfamily serine protease
VSRILPAVASIDAGAARGTGFFIRTDQVLTNAHVVQGQTSVRLQVGAASYSARVINVSAGTDLALLQVMEKAAEAARQAGVYPGVLRDLRRQHRLQWSGWDR